MCIYFICGETHSKHVFKLLWGSTSLHNLKIYAEDLDRLHIGSVFVALVSVSLDQLCLVDSVVWVQVLSSSTLAPRIVPPTLLIPMVLPRV